MSACIQVFLGLHQHSYPMFYFRLSLVSNKFLINFQHCFLLTLYNIQTLLLPPLHLKIYSLSPATLNLFPLLLQRVLSQFAWLQHHEIFQSFQCPVSVHNILIIP